MSLETCDNCHDEIVYTEEYRGGKRSECPLCAANDKIDTTAKNLRAIWAFDPGTLTLDTTRSPEEWQAYIDCLLKNAHDYYAAHIEAELD